MTTFMIYTYIEPELLARTVAKLAPGRVLVHVDAKIDEEPFIAAIREGDRGRVEFVRPRHKVNWAGYSQIRAIRTLLARALEITEPNQYVVMMSGQDYPLYPGDALDDFFAQAEGKQFLRYFRIDESDGAYRDQYYHRHYRDLPLLSNRRLTPRARKIRTASILGVDRLARLLPTPTPPAGFTACFGPTHFAMTAEFAAYLEGMITPEVEQFFRTTFCPEEIMYQTLAASGPRRINNGSSREDGSEPFVGRGNPLYANLHHIDPTLIKVYTLDDWEEVAASDKLFLRKLTMTSSASLLDCIDETDAERAARHGLHT